jgi:hypothetical protein
LFSSLLPDCISYGIFSSAAHNNGDVVVAAAPFAATRGPANAGSIAAAAAAAGHRERYGAGNPPFMLLLTKVNSQSHLTLNDKKKTKCKLFFPFQE